MNFSESTSNKSSFGDESLLIYGRFQSTMPILGAIVVTVNITTIVIFHRSKTITGNLKVYICSLMVCDCFTGLILLVVPIVHLRVGATRLVDLSVAAIQTMLLISVLHTAGLAVDRLIAVKQPIFYSLRVTKTTCATICMSIWLTLSVYQVMVSSFLSNNTMSGQFDKTAYAIFLSIYFSCLVIYLGSSKTIIACARDHLCRLSHCPQHVETNKEQHISNTFRLSIVVTTASGCLFALYLPVEIFIILTFIDPKREMAVTQFFLDISYPLCTFESLFNPILYLIRFKENRKAIKRFFCPSRVGCQVITGQTPWNTDQATSARSNDETKQSNQTSVLTYKQI